MRPVSLLVACAVLAFTCTRGVNKTVAFTPPAAVGMDTAYHVYLTIDDGPSEYSSAINQLCLTDSMKINVFLVGNRICGAAGFKQEWEQYRSDPFIEISNHSFSHASGHYLDYYRKGEEVAADVVRNEDSLMLTQKILRLPGRNTWRLQGRKFTDLADANQAADILAANGYRIFGWDLEWRCPKNAYDPIASADSMIGKITTLLHKNATFTAGHLVLLCHEYMFHTPHNMEQLRLFGERMKHRPGIDLAWLSNYPAR